MANNFRYRKLQKEISRSAISATFVGSPFNRIPIDIVYTALYPSKS